VRSDAHRRIRALFADLSERGEITAEQIRKARRYRDLDRRVRNAEIVKVEKPRVIL